MKVFFRRIHLYLAFACGLVFFIQCLSGTVLVFEEEITHALHAGRYAVAVPAGQPRLSLAQLSAAFRQTHPTNKILGFKVYADPARTAELSFKDPKAKDAGPGGPGGEGSRRGPDMEGGERGPRSKGGEQGSEARAEGGERGPRTEGGERGPQTENGNGGGQASHTEGSERGPRAENGEGGERSPRAEGSERSSRAEGGERGGDGPRAEGGGERGPGGGRGFGGGRGRQERGSTAFLNPYTGQLTATLGPRERPFFSWVEDLHRHLVAGKVGGVLTGLSAVFILFITITGIVLWWPSAKQALRHHLRVKWDARWKRVNYDLHSVVGFYCSLFLFVLAFTGVIMAYHWATDGLYWVTGTRPTMALAAPVSAAPSAPDAVAYDAALQTGQRTYPGAEFWRVGVPGSPVAAVPVSAPSTLVFRSSGLDTLFADRASGAILAQHPYARQTAGAQLRRVTKPLHTGEIGGLWTKILVFVVALCGLTFPVTGVIMWLNRTRKQGKLRRQRPVVA